MLIGPKSPRTIYRMTFEEERIADEKAQAFHDRMAEILADVQDPTPDQIAAAIGRAHQDLDSDHGELRYELDDEC
jgi:hypothetical protein